MCKLHRSANFKSERTGISILDEDGKVMLLILDTTVSCVKNLASFPCEDMLVEHVAV